MDAYVVQHHGDKPGDVLEVHLVREDAAKRVTQLNKLSAHTYWYTVVPLRHRLLLGTEQGKVTSATAQVLDAKSVTTQG